MIKKILTLSLNIIYTGVVLVVLAIAVLFVGTKVDLLGYEVKIVQSGSMEPQINTGGVVVIAPAPSYQVGDVITFGKDTGSSIPVTHRIVERHEGRITTFTTMGDANEDPDPRPVSEASVIGKVLFDIPYIGRILEFARTPLGFGLLIGIPATIIVLDEIANISWEIHKYRARVRRGKVGYRVPAREHRPKQQFSPPPPAKQSERGINSEHVLDLRTYKLNRPAS